MLTLLAALQGEADAILSRAQDVCAREAFGKTIYTGHCGGPFRLIVTGVGKSNAAAGAMLALALDAAEAGDRSVLASVGTAGGLNRKAPVGCVTAAVRAVQFDVDLSPVNHTPQGTLNEYETPYIPLCEAKGFPAVTLATADRFGDGRDAALLRSLGCDVQDMEGAAVAHVAERAGVPCYAFKAISDNADDDGGRAYYENLRIALDALGRAVPAMFAACKEAE